MMLLTPIIVFVISHIQGARISVPLARSYRQSARGRQLMDNEHDLNLTSVQDVYYHGPLVVGNQTYKLIFDTGSSLTFVPHVELSDSKQPTHDCANSSTCKSSTPQFDVRYGSGRVKGELVYERVDLAGAVLDEYKLGLATDVQFPQFSEEDYQGICGLAWPSLSSDYDVLPIVLALRQADQIPAALFAMYLTEGGGELVLGETDPDQYVGNITWVPLVQRSWWTLVLAAVHVSSGDQEDTVPRALDQLSDLIIVDSGTSLISGPSAKVAAIILALETQSGVHIKEDIVGGATGVQYSVRCVETGKLTAVTLFLQGGDNSIQQFTVTGESLMVGRISSSHCLLGISGSTTADEGWILGDSWLRSFYTVYDYDNSRLGFAVAQSPQPGALVSASSSNSEPPPSAYVLCILLAVLIL